VEGGAEAAYAHQFSSTGPGFSIGLAVPPESRVFVGVEPDGTPNGGPDRGTLLFALDSFPEPGTYAPRALGAPDAGLRRARTVGVLLASSSAATIWRPVGGQVRFARVPGTRDGLRATFTLRFVRRQGGPSDSATVDGALETR